MILDYYRRPRFGGYYSEYYANKEDRDGKYYKPDHSAWQKDTCLSLRFDMSDQWLIKLEGHYINGTAIILKTHNQVNFDPDNIDLTEEWMLFGIKLTFNF